MLICLPVLSFVFLILFYRNKFSSLGWRAGYILAAVTLTSGAVIFVEIAGLFLSITSSLVTGFWLAMAILSAGLLWRSDAKKLFALCVVPELGIFEIVCIAGILLIFLLNASIAFSFPPNNWDSMTYHLPRVMHWAVDRSVHFYPTQIIRQLFSQPGAEFLLLHCFLLTGDDRWFNLLQWTSLVGCVFSASLITKLLGAGARGQVLAALFVVTIPMALLQSTSTQTDLFVSFWAIVFVALSLLLKREFSRVVFYAAAAALGLSALAKGTFFVAFPFAVFFCITLWKKDLKYIFVCSGIVLVLIAGHYCRSWAWQDGHSLISNEQSDLMMKRHDLGGIAVNGISQIASELMLPWEPVNQSMEKAVQKITVFLGVDAKSQDMFGQIFTSPVYPNLVFDEDYASNPLHMILIGAVLLFLWRLGPSWEIRIYCLSVIASCFLFIVIVRWQPFVTRLHLPLFILFSPLVGVLTGSWWRWLAKLISISLLGVAFLMIIFHQTRPLGQINNSNGIPREAYYFMKKRAHFFSYEHASRIILSSRCRDAGLLQGEDSWEYPLWALTGFGAVHYRGLDQDNLQGALPCMVVTIDVPRNNDILWGTGRYKLVWQEAPLQIFMPNR